MVKSHELESNPTSEVGLVGPETSVGEMVPEPTAGRSNRRYRRGAACALVYAPRGDGETRRRASDGHAFGDHLGLATLIVVLTLSSMLGGLSPVPGGMGVVEAGMILGLTAAGISQTDAVAATFVQRLFTAYLPPIWGWFVLVWLRKKDYL
jgi:Lysylphosphatidylglycerol synthase TM region